MNVRHRGTRAASALPALIVLCQLSFVSAATYYVRAGGSDGADGASDNTAWATIAHAAAVCASGDIVQVRRGDTLRESASFPQSNITVRDYGSTGLPLPVISGGTTIGGWTVYNGSILQANSGRPIQNLYVNGQLATIARYPNSAWMLSAVQATDHLQLASLPNLKSHTPNRAHYWQDATIRWRPWSWWFVVRRVADYDSSTGLLTLPPPDNSGGSNTGWRFYLDNKLEELDTANEWYHDTQTGAVYLWPPGGANPQAMTVEGSYLATGLTFSGTGQTLQNIAFTCQTRSGLVLSGRGVATVTGCRFTNIGSDSGSNAVDDYEKIVMSGCRFENCLDNGLVISDYASNWPTDTALVTQDTFLNIGTVGGYGPEGVNAANSHFIAIFGCNVAVNIRNNYIENTGYSAIEFNPDGTAGLAKIIEYNVIKHAMATLNDGGGIYGGANQLQIRHNIIMNVEGYMRTASNVIPVLGHGIWPEFLFQLHGHDIEYNTIINCGAFGLFLPNNFTSTIRYNTFYGNGRGQLELSGMNDSTVPQSHEIDHNILVGTSRPQPTLSFGGGYNYGTMHANRFCNPYTDSSIYLESPPNTFTIAQWRVGRTWADDSARGNVILRPAGTPDSDGYGTPSILYNDQMQPVTFDLQGARYLSADSQAVTGSVTLQPFTSIVLFRNEHVGVVAARPRAPGFAFHIVNGHLELHAPGAGTIVCVLFDIQGRRAATVSRAVTHAGSYSLPLAGRAAPGIYSYALTFLNPAGMTRESKGTVLVGR